MDEDDDFIPFGAQEWWEYYRAMHDRERLAKKDFVLRVYRSAMEENAITAEDFEVLERAFADQERRVLEIRRLEIELLIAKYKRDESVRALDKDLMLPTANPKFNIGH